MTGLKYWEGVSMKMLSTEQVILTTSLDLAVEGQRPTNDICRPIFRIWPHCLTFLIDSWTKREILEKVTAHDQQLSFSQVLSGAHSLAPAKDVMPFQTRMLSQRSLKIRTGLIEPPVWVVHCWVDIAFRILRHSDIQDVNHTSLRKMIAIELVVCCQKTWHTCYSISRL
jgi:hypothetical protein